MRSALSMGARDSTVNTRRPRPTGRRRPGRPDLVARHRAPHGPSPPNRPDPGRRWLRRHRHRGRRRTPRSFVRALRRSSRARSPHPVQVRQIEPWSWCCAVFYPASTHCREARPRRPFSSSRPPGSRCPVSSRSGNSVRTWSRGSRPVPGGSTACGGCSAASSHRRFTGTPARSPPRSRRTRGQPARGAPIPATPYRPFQTSAPAIAPGRADSSSSVRPSARPRPRLRPPPGTARAPVTTPPAGC